MDTGASAIDHPDPAIVDFIENSRLMPRGMSARFERLPGGVSSDIWLVHGDDTSFCVKRALAQLRVAADWRAPIERNTKEAAWIKAVAGFMPEAVPSLLAEDAQAGMFAMDYLSPRSFEGWKAQLQHAMCCRPPPPKSADAWCGFTANLRDPPPRRRSLRPTRFSMRSALSRTCWLPRRLIRTGPWLWRSSLKRRCAPS